MELNETQRLQVRVTKCLRLRNARVARYKHITATNPGISHVNCAFEKTSFVVAQRSKSSKKQCTPDADTVECAKNDTRKQSDCATRTREPQMATHFELNRSNGETLFFM